MAAPILLAFISLENIRSKAWGDLRAGILIHCSSGRIPRYIHNLSPPDADLASEQKNVNEVWNVVFEDHLAWKCLLA
jgi:hypothetical protein